MRFVIRQGDRDRIVDVEEEGGRWRLALDGDAREVGVVESDQGSLTLLVDGKAHACDFAAGKGSQVKVHLGQSIFDFEVLDERRARRRVTEGGAGAAGPQRVVAPMPGKVTRLLVRVGQSVKAGEGLVVIEAMKMENELRASRPGTVKEISVQEGQAVEGSALLCVVE